MPNCDVNSRTVGSKAGSSRFGIPASLSEPVDSSECGALYMVFSGGETTVSHIQTAVRVFLRFSVLWGGHSVACECEIVQ